MPYVSPDELRAWRNAMETATDVQRVDHEAYEKLRVEKNIVIDKLQENLRQEAAAYAKLQQQYTDVVEELRNQPQPIVDEISKGFKSLVQIAKEKKEYDEAADTLT